jgi:hypothetical protein
MPCKLWLALARMRHTNETEGYQSAIIPEVHGKVE